MFGKLKAAMAVIGMGNALQRDIFGVVSACALLGNVAIDDAVEQGRASIADRSFLYSVANLLGVPIGKLEEDVRKDQLDPKRIIPPVKRKLPQSSRKSPKWDEPGLPDSLRRLAQLIQERGGKITKSEVNQEQGRYPSNIFADHKNNKHWQDWIEQWIYEPNNNAIGLGTTPKALHKNSKTSRKKI